MLVALVTLVSFALLYPVIESFDTWDTVPGPGGDSEIQIIALLTLVGLLFVLNQLLRLAGSVSKLHAFRSTIAFADSRVRNVILGSLLTPSTPPPLRI